MRTDQTAFVIVLNHTTIAFLTRRLYPRLVSEIDDIWAELLDKRSHPASAQNRIVADFIHLKTTNDEIRQRAVDWLLGLFIEMAGLANRHNIPIAIERSEPHSFSAYGANMPLSARGSAIS